MGDCGETVQTLTLYWNNTWDSGKLVRAGMLSLLFTRVVGYFIHLDEHLTLPVDNWLTSKFKQFVTVSLHVTS